MKIGFIGLGRMGACMAANLLKAGHEVVVYNRSPAKAQDLVAQGARLSGAVADACGGEAVITMLADDKAVEDVALRGRRHRRQPGQIRDPYFVQHDQR